MLKFYDFKCYDCGKEFEKLVKTIADIECPLCGSTHTQKIMSPSSIKVTGVGVYDRKMRV